MPVTCPHCNTRYVLPQALLGPGGARVRCPRCREPFSVGPGGDVLEESPKAATAAVTNGPEESVASGAAFLAKPSVAVVNGAAAVDPKHRAFMPPDDSATGPAPEAVDVAEAPAPAPAKAAIPAEAPAPEPERTKPTTPTEVAEQVLEDLATHSGEALRLARAHGTLFREFGPVIAEAFEFYRRQLGPGADPAPFRAALKERWGVDLDPGQPGSRVF